MSSFDTVHIPRRHDRDAAGDGDRAQFRLLAPTRWLSEIAPSDLCL